MLCEIEIPTDFRNLECFKVLLQRYKGSYTTALREIRINTILGKKCQLDINIDDSSILCDTRRDPDTLIRDCATVIHKLIIIIDGDSNITSPIKAEYEILKTPSGKIIESLVDNGISIITKPKIYNGQIIGFYIES